MLGFIWRQEENKKDRVPFFTKYFEIIPFGSRGSFQDRTAE